MANLWHKEASRLLFNILIAFLLTFILAHLYSLFVPFYIFISGYHIHHFYHGMFLLAVAAIGAVLTNRGRIHNFLSYVIGVGLGLIVDELGLLLSCTGERLDVFCSYHFPSQVDFVVIVSLVLLLFIFFGDKPIRWCLPKSWRPKESFSKSVYYSISRAIKELRK